MEVFMGKRVALTALVLLLLATPLLAQTEQQAVVNVRSNPSGATVVLSGDHTVAGVTPTTFSQPLRGFYRVSASREGFETYHSSVVLTGKDAITINIPLTPKTRFKAGLRSLLVPGWGQRYAGSKTRGAFITIGALASATVAGLLYLHFDNERDTYYEVKHRYDTTRDVAARQSMLSELYGAQKDAYDAERTKNVAVGILVGYWAYNVLDAMVFFPDFGMTVSGVDISLQPQFESDQVKLVGVFEF